MEPEGDGAQNLADAWDWEEAKRIQALEDQCLLDSRPYFSEILEDLTRSSAAIIGPSKFQIHQKREHVLALAYAKRKALRRHRFDIVVTQGLYNLFFQLSRLYHFTGLVTTVHGRIVERPVMTYGRAVCMCGKALIDYIEDGKGGVSPDYPLWLGVQRGIDERLPARWRNGNFGVLYQQHMTLFVLAHEIGHALSGHLDMEPAKTQKDTWSREFAADAIAIKLHAHWVKDRLSKTRLPESAEEFEQQRESFNRSQAMGGAALALAVWEVAESFAKDSGKDWTQSHPPASERFARYREIAAEEFGTDASFFETGEYFGPSPSKSLEFLKGLGSKIRASGPLREIREIDIMWAGMITSYSPKSEFLSRLPEFDAKAKSIPAVANMPLVEAQVCRDIGIIAFSERPRLARLALRRSIKAAQRLRGPTFSENIDARDIEASALEGLAYIELNRGRINDALVLIARALKLLGSLATDQHLWSAERIIKIGDLVHEAVKEAPSVEQATELLWTEHQAIAAAMSMAQEWSAETILTLADMQARIVFFLNSVGFNPARES